MCGLTSMPFKHSNVSTKPNNASTCFWVARVFGLSTYVATSPDPHRIQDTMPFAPKRSASPSAVTVHGSCDQDSSNQTPRCGGVGGRSSMSTVWFQPPQGTCGFKEMTDGHGNQNLTCRIGGTSSSTTTTTSSSSSSSSSSSFHHHHHHHHSIIIHHPKV